MASSPTGVPCATAAIVNECSWVREKGRRLRQHQRPATGFNCNGFVADRRPLRHCSDRKRVQLGPGEGSTTAARISLGTHHQSVNIYRQRPSKKTTGIQMHRFGLGPDHSDPSAVCVHILKKPESARPTSSHLYSRRASNVTRSRDDSYDTDYIAREFPFARQSDSKNPYNRKYISGPAISSSRQGKSSGIML